MINAVCSSVCGGYPFPPSSSIARFRAPPANRIVTMNLSHMSSRNSDASEPYTLDAWEKRGMKNENNAVNANQPTPVNSAPGIWLLSDLHFAGRTA